MGLLSPWLLAGLGLLALPLWLHLLRKHKSEPLSFSSLMFFEQHTQASVKHRRLDHLLLLLMRLLLLTFFIFALAQPFIMRTGMMSGTENRLHVLILDESASMGYEDRMAKAKAEAVSMLTQVKPGSKWQIGAYAAQLRLLTQPVDDPAALRAAIESLVAGPSRSSLGELARALRGLAEANKVPLEVHLFSDLQRTSLPSGFAEVRLGDNTTLSLHPAATEDKPNWSVESVAAPRRLGDPKKARVEVTLASYAPAAAERKITLMANGKVLAAKSVSIPPNGRAKAEFLGLDLPYGLNRCEARIEPGDGLTADDRLMFSVERSDPRKVAFLYGPRADRSVLYFQSALESASENVYALESFPAGQASGLSFDKYAFVVLSDVPELGSLEAPLRKYVEGGGAIWIALGPQAAARPKVPLTGDAILESRTTQRSGERFQSLDTADETHPSIKKAERWANVKFYQAAVIKPEKARTLARLSDQTPILLEQTLGEGRVVIFASALDNLSNDFPLHASFVPFVEQTANYLSGQEDRSGGYTVDSFLDLRQAQNQTRAAAVDVLDPDGKRALGLGEAAKAQTLPLTKPGYYEIRRGSGRAEMIAVNVDRRESDLTLIPKDALELWQGGELKNTPGGAPKPDDPKPWSFGRWILGAALLALVMEALVATRTLKTEAV